MPNITITNDAHKALMACAKNVRMTGSIRTKGGWLLSIDDETQKLLDDKSKAMGTTDYSKVIVTVCK